MRSEFSVAYSKWSASGHNDDGNFDNFINGKLYLKYWFLALRDSPSLELATRLIPTDSALDAGAKEASSPIDTRHRGPRGPKNSNIQAAEIIATSLAGGAVTDSAQKRARTTEEATAANQQAQVHYFEAEAQKSQAEIEGTKLSNKRAKLELISQTITETADSTDPEEIEVRQSLIAKRVKIMRDLAADDDED